MKKVYLVALITSFLLFACNQQANLQKNSSSDSIDKKEIVNHNTKQEKTQIENTAPRKAVKSSLNTESTTLPKKVNRKLFNAISTLPKPKISLQEFKEAIAVKSQYFRADPSKAIIIKGKEGTIIQFLPFSFVHENGKYINEPISIELKEYYTATSLVSDNLATVSNGELLETGGSIYINATTRDQEISLKEGAQYRILFPNNNENTEMETFYGDFNNSNIVNWQDDQEAKRDEQMLSARKDLENSRKNIAIDFANNTNPSCKIAAKPYGASSYAIDGTYMSLYEYIWDNFEPSETTKEILCENPYAVNFDVNINKEGYIDSVRLHQGYHPALRKELKDFLLSLPRLDTNVRNKSLAYNRISFAVAKFYVNVRPNNLPIQKISFPLIPGVIDTNYTSLTASNLKWINCDAFAMYNSPRINLSFKMPRGNNAIYLFVHDQKSFMMSRQNGNEACFDRIPTGIDVTLIALHSNEEGVLLAKKELNTGEIPAFEFAYEAFTANEISNFFKFYE